MTMSCYCHPRLSRTIQIYHTRRSLVNLDILMANEDIVINIFSHDRPWISPWIKSISNELDITIQVIASQFSGHCDVISTRLWRHQQNVDWASEPRGRCVKIFVFIVVYGFVMSCKKQNHVCTLMTNCVRAHSSVILLFISLVAVQLGK